MVREATANEVSAARAMSGRWVDGVEARIVVLRNNAGQAGDDKMVKICDVALEKGEDSAEWRECLSVLADTDAQGD